MSDARKAILADVEHVSKKGTPGTMIVHGISATAIMTNEKADVFIGTGKIGKGQVVVFSQVGYTKLFLEPPTSDHQLVKNVKIWVTQGSYNDDSEIENADKYKDFDDIPKTCKILVWFGDREKSEVFYEKMKKWTMNGGGIVCGTNPWGYLQNHPDRSLEKMPLTNILNIAGIRYTDRYLKGPEKIDVSDNLADNSHVNDAIKASNEDIANLVKYGTNIDGAITYLSDTELEKILPDIYQMIEKHKKTNHCIPTKSNPVKTDAGKSLASMMNRIMLQTGQYNGKVAEGIDEFPYDFTTPPKLTSGKLSVANIGYISRLFPTEYYLPAGQELTVSWSSVPSKEWRIVVGSHRDHLYNVSSAWRRWPQIQIERKLESSPLKFKSPFGGAIYLRSPDNKDATLTVNLENVVSTPHFKPGKGAEWNTLRNRAGLWADVSGEEMTITLPSSSIRSLPDPTATMALWDEVVNAHYNLRGKDPSSGRGQWAVTDEQPVAGYMHAGYPIITKMDVADPDKDNGFLLDGELLKSDGMWGMFHELGHNLQDSSWTFSGTGEVTCNIFTLHAMDVITGQKPWTHPWVKGQYENMRQYLQAGANFQEWTSKPGVALGIYAQLARDFGWASYKAIFREYDNLPSDEKPNNDDQKIDQWIMRYSKQTLSNLCPMFDFWGFPIRSGVLDSVKHLKAYLHSDETTDEMAPDRAAEIRRKYGMSDEDEVMGASCKYSPIEMAPDRPAPSKSFACHIF